MAHGSPKPSTNSKRTASGCEDIEETIYGCEDIERTLYMAERTLTKDDAAAMIQAGRRELAAEAQWLRHNMSPKRIASKVAHDHTGALIACGLGIGIVASLLILRAHRNKDRHPVAAYRNE